MSLLVVAYPSITPHDLEIIQQYRNIFDHQFHIINPHFTLVFPVPDVGDEIFIHEVRKRAEKISRIEFNISTSSVHKDMLSDRFMEYLVPEGGYDAIVDLHDRLYSGILNSFWRKDIKFIPHITIGSSSSESESESRLRQMNMKDLSIRGSINQLSIISFENNKLRTLDNIHYSDA